jgi:hypothetical protein
MARALPKKKSFAQALKAVRATTRGAEAPARWRWSEARGGYYAPIRGRSRKGKLAASKYDVMSCSAGATAAMIRGFAASPRLSCGPKGMGTIRSHRLLGYWKGITMGSVGSLSGYKKNPADGDLAFVYQPNPGGEGVEWGLIEPRSNTVLLTGTAASPESAYKAAHKRARAAMAKGNPEMRSSGEFVDPFAASHSEMRSSGEWADVPRGGRRGGAKKNTGKKKKNPDAARAALRNAMKGT